MSKHVSFPASHLSAYDIGKRIQVITVDGAKITDVLTRVTAEDHNGVTRLYLTFASVNSVAYCMTSGAFEVKPDQYVRRIGE